MNPFHLTYRTLFNLDGSFYGSFYEREGQRAGWVRLATYQPEGEPMVDEKGRALVEWKGRLFRCTLD